MILFWYSNTLEIIIHLLKTLIEWKKKRHCAINQFSVYLGGARWHIFFLRNEGHRWPKNLIKCFWLCTKFMQGFAHAGWRQAAAPDRPECRPAQIVFPIFPCSTKFWWLMKHFSWFLLFMSVRKGHNRKFRTNITGSYSYKIQITFC